MNIKKLFSILFALLFSVILYGQVGVNTANPQGTFHIDGAKDNAASGVPTAAQQANDFVVTSSGNIGIGVTTPNAKVEISSGTSGVSGLKFKDLNSSSPTIQSDKNLSVDATGNVVLSVPVAKASDLGLFASDAVGLTPTLTSSYPNYTITTYTGETADSSDSFNPSTGVYTVPTAGYYYFQGVVTFDNTQAGSGFQDTGLRIYKGNSTISQQFTNSGGTSKLATVSVSAIVLCVAGDQITLRHTASDVGFQYKIAGRSLMGWKISNP